MDNIRNSKILNIVDALSRAIGFNGLKGKVNGYYSMSDIDVIQDLLEIINDNIQNNPDLLNYCTVLISNINPTIDLNTINNQIISRDEYIKNAFKELMILFNSEEIDYCALGMLPFILQEDIKLNKNFESIDILINEDDLGKVKNVMEVLGYSFIDMRIPTINELHEMKDGKCLGQLYAENSSNNVRINFQIFRREKDHGITTIEYLNRESNNEVITDLIERYYSLVAASLRFSDTCNYDGIESTTCSLEYIYDMKSKTTKPEDILDLKILEEYIDKEKLKELRQNTNTKQIIKNIDVQKEITK